MARQLAALPKKQFELYRSKKILSGDHSFLCHGSSQVFKDKLGTDFISDSAFLEMSSEYAKKGKSLKSPVEKDTPEEVAVMPSTPAKKKKKKSKKNKSWVTTNEGQSLLPNDKTVNLSELKMEEKLFDMANGGQVSVQLSRNIVDISANHKDIITKTAATECEQTDEMEQHEETEENGQKPQGRVTGEEKAEDFEGKKTALYW